MIWRDCPNHRESLHPSQTRGHTVLRFLGRSHGDSTSKAGATSGLGADWIVTAEESTASPATSVKVEDKEDLEGMARAADWLDAEAV